MLFINISIFLMDKNLLSVLSCEFLKLFDFLRQIHIYTCSLGFRIVKKIAFPLKYKSVSDAILVQWNIVAGSGPLSSALMRTSLGYTNIMHNILFVNNWPEKTSRSARSAKIYHSHLSEGHISLSVPQTIVRREMTLW